MTENREALPRLSASERVVVEAMRRKEQYYHEIDFGALLAENQRLRGLLAEAYHALGPEAHLDDTARRIKAAAFLDIVGVAPDA
jgi:hypothetical protein